MSKRIEEKKKEDENVNHYHYILLYNTVSLKFFLDFRHI